MREYHEHSYLVSLLFAAPFLLLIIFKKCFFYLYYCIPDVGPSDLKDNYGYQTLVYCSEKIIAGLSSEPKSVGDSLHGEGLVSTEVLREISELPATKTDNARKLYLSILRTVQHYPNRFSDFIPILSGNVLLYSDLLRALEETYNMYQEKEKG